MSPRTVLALLLSGCASTGPAPSVALRADKVVRARAARVDVHYVELAAEDPAKTPAVFIHPWGADLDIWLDVAPQLSARRRAVLVDLPGHGRSGEPPGAYPPRRLAQAVLGALDDAGIDRAIFVGNSIGGGTALAIAELAPERVAGLVLVGAPGGQPVPQMMQKAVGETVNPRALSTVSPAVVEALWFGISGQQTPAVQRLSARAVLARKSPSWRRRAPAQASALAEVIAYAPKLEELHVPTLVVQGEDDRVVFADGGRALAERIEGAELALLEDCGHFPQAECPERFIAPVAAFFAQIDRAR